MFREIPLQAVRVCDLIIPCSSEIFCVFYFVIRDCLYVADLKRASAVAYSFKFSQYPKVVTSSGLLIQESGAVTGYSFFLDLGNVMMPLRNCEVGGILDFR